MAAANSIDQHLQSRALVKRFVDADGKLRFYDLRARRSVVKSYGRAGRGGRYTPHAPAEIEAAWRVVENAAAKAFVSLDDHTIFDRPDHVQALKHMLALHFFRTEGKRRLWDESLRARLQLSFERLQAEHGEQLATFAFEQTGRRPTTRDEMFGALVAYAETKPELEEVFETLQQGWFERSGFDVARRGLEAFDTRLGLVFSDAGTVPLDEKRRAALATAYLHATALVLPVGRNVLISLGPENHRQALGDELVLALNREQFKAARSRVYSHPEDDFGKLMELTGQVRDGEE